MSSKRGTVLVSLALVIAMGALGYVIFMHWQLQESLAVSGERQERNLKEMMISLAHTEGQLGRVKEAMNAFDLQKWLATVQGPLVDRLEEKLSAGQREMVREEVKKWAQEITREQAGHWDALTKSLAEVRGQVQQEAVAANTLGLSLTNLMREGEARAKAHQADIQSQFTALIQNNKGIQERLRQSQGPTAEVQAQIEHIKKQNKGLSELLEQQGQADEELRASVRETLAAFVDAAEQQKLTTQEQIDHAEKRWQGLFLTLRENHEAELESFRAMLAQLGEDSVSPPAKVTRAEPKGVKADPKVIKAEPTVQRPGGSFSEGADDGEDGRLGALLKFCARRPESVLCRDIEIR